MRCLTLTIIILGWKKLNMTLCQVKTGKHECGTRFASDGFILKSGLQSCKRICVKKHDYSSLLQNVKQLCKNL